MKYIIFLISSLLSINSFSQTHKDSISFKSDLWIVDTFEEGIRPPNDTFTVKWVEKKFTSKPIIYIDVSENGSLVGINYPIKLKLSSSGQPKNGYLGKKVFKNYAFYEECYLVDETGYIWRVIVGKDSYWVDPEKKDEGRIYIVIIDPKNIKSSYYFTLKTFGGRRK